MFSGYPIVLVSTTYDVFTKSMYLRRFEIPTGEGLAVLWPHAIQDEHELRTGEERPRGRRKNRAIEHNYG